MNRLPPSLLYLTIYNPTLQPSGPLDDENEDAEEQAHILFYTSRERAVSRDRMLRQIGLAKALINFSELFNAASPCENVHSQSRRMIMLSPEPGFWVHAGIDLAKSQRTVDSKTKSKAKGKTVDRGKVADPTPVYDYVDGSVHDGAIRAHILKGYEKFKLTHGSFASILSKMGQQALELQLERFWTVWAWSWDMENSSPFGEDFGPLLHPHFSSLIPILDQFCVNLPSELTPLILTRQHIIPSERYVVDHYSPALAAHLSSIIPVTPDASHSSDTLNTLASSVDTIRGKQTSNSKSKGQTVNAEGGTNFLTSIPSINMNMDMRKWNWPGYLTFGKGSSKDTPESRSTKEKVEEPFVHASTHQEIITQMRVEVNTEALEDAISSDSMSMLAQDRNAQIDNQDTGDHENSPRLGQIDDSAKTEHFDHEESVLPSGNSISSSLSPLTFDHPEDSPPASPTPLPEFSLTKLHLAPCDNPTATRRRTIHYFIRGSLMLALINTEEEDSESQDVTDMQSATEGSIKLLDDVESSIYDADAKSVSESLPSANKILQPQDKFIMTSEQFTHSSPSFSSTSAHLFNAKAILDNDPNILDVFSRGQNPQHWHIAKRALGKSTIKPKTSTSTSDDAVFLEVFRKETSLTDVDNVLAGIVKKSGLVESVPSSR